MERIFKWIWIPAEIWLHEKLSLQEKVFLVEIASLDNEKGCWANNAYFASFFHLSERRVSTVIASLIEQQLLSSEIDKESGNKRTLRVVSFPSTTYRTNLLYPIEQNVYHNNTYNNTENNNNISAVKASPKITTSFSMLYALYIADFQQDKKKYFMKAKALLYLEQLSKEFTFIYMENAIKAYKQTVDPKYWMSPQYFFSNSKNANAKHYRPFIDYWDAEKQEKKAVDLSFFN